MREERYTVASYATDFATEACIHIPGPRNVSAQAVCACRYSKAISASTRSTITERGTTSATSSAWPAFSMVATIRRRGGVKLLFMVNGFQHDKRGTRKIS